jgi:hypothetical protein
MSNSFAEFLARLHSQDDAAAKELFGRFAHQLIALALRHIDAGLRHKVDPEDVVESAYKSFFFGYGDGNLDAVNWNSLWGLLALITVRKSPNGPPIIAPSAGTPRGKCPRRGGMKRRRGWSPSAASRHRLKRPC